MTSKQVNNDVARFLQRGGQIHQLPRGRKRKLSEPKAPARVRGMRRYIDEETEQGALPVTVINITQQDIDAGGHQSFCCPLLHAIGRACSASYIGIVHGYITLGYTLLNGDNARLELELPQEVESWLHEYDMLRPVQPLTFDLAIPPHLVREVA